MMPKYSVKEVVDFVRSVSVMQVAVNNDPYPVVSVLLFAIDDDLTVYFASRENTFKVKALSKDARISMVVWEHFKMLVQMGGVAERVGGNEVSGVLDKLALAAADIEDFWPPVLRTDNGGYVVFKIKLDFLGVLDISSKTISESEPAMYQYDLKSL